MLFLGACQKMRNMPMTALGQGNSPMKSDEQNGDIWSYRETSHRAVRGAMTFGSIVSGVAALFAGDSFTDKLPLLLMFVLVSGLLMWHVKRITTVVIGRKDGTIRKDKRSVIFSRCRTYSLRDFHTIALAERACEDRRRRISDG